MQEDEDLAVAGEVVVEGTAIPTEEEEGEEEKEAEEEEEEEEEGIPQVQEIDLSGLKSKRLFTTPILFHVHYVFVVISLRICHCEKVFSCKYFQIV